MTHVRFWAASLAIATAFALGAGGCDLPGNTGTGGAGGGAGTGGTSAGGRGGSGVSACRVADCGGDPTGSWSLQAGCVPSLVGTRVPTTVCSEGAAVKDVSVAGDQTISFFSDGRYQSNNAGLSITATLSFSATCVGAQTCDDIEQVLLGLDSTSLVACARAADGGCQCTVTDVSGAISETGTYALDGKTLVSTPDSGQPQRYGFCRADRELTLLGQGGMVTVYRAR